jgi:hypothetical protein
MWSSAFWQEVMIMRDNWEERLSCATKCSRCDKELDKRIFSVYDHQPICMECKREEESRSDYEEVSKGMIGQCMAETEQFYGDPGGYCFHHFYPFTCKE